MSVLGHNVAEEWDRVKELFGYVPDRENHFEEFTGRRNLLIFAGLYDVPRSRVEECLAMVELTEAADLPVRAYSLGMRRKLLLARGLLHKPRLLYLDEPTANLDIHSAEVVHRILRALTREGVTVLLTTHNMQEVEAICDRVAILCRGKLVALDSPFALRQQHAERKADVILNNGERLETTDASGDGKVGYLSAPGSYLEFALPMPNSGRYRLYVRAGNGTGKRLVFDLDEQLDAIRLSQHLIAGEVASVKTREFNFHETFLKLTGTAFE